MKVDVHETLLAVMQMFDHPHQWYGGRTYAQHGDDLAILNIFGCLRIKQPSYIDIGAHHPFRLSNTALLYQRGSRGINVEANPDLIEEFERLRPEDTNVCAAVVGSPRSGSVTLNRVGPNTTSGLNSLLPVPGHSLHDQVEVPACTADELVDKFADGCWPDLLSIDAEGMDIEILSSIDYVRGGPKVVCAEAVSPGGDSCDELRNLMLVHGYTVHSFAGSNMMFVRTNLMDMCR